MRKLVRKPRAGGEWTEARFWSFIRGGLRQMSRRWPPIARQVWLANRRKYTGSNKRQKWEFLCAGCGHWFMRGEMHSDHIVACGRMSSFDEIGDFCRRLFCEPAGLRICCEECHADRHRTEEFCFTENGHANSHLTGDLYTEQHITRDELRHLNSVDVCAYAVRLGWKYVPTKNSAVMLLQHPTRELRQLLIPTNAIRDDNLSLFYDAIRTLADDEQRPPRTIFKALLSVNEVHNE